MVWVYPTPKLLTAHIKHNIFTRNGKRDGDWGLISKRLPNVQNILYFRQPKLFFKISEAVSQVGLVNPGRGLSTRRKFLVGSQGDPGTHVLLIRKVLQRNRFEDFSGGSQCGRLSCSIWAAFHSMGSLLLRSPGRRSAGGQQRKPPLRSPAWSCHSPTLLWTRYKKSFMGWCGANWWKPALFYFCSIFLLELILWKEIVSGPVCLYRPCILLRWAKFAKSARK